MNQVELARLCFDFLRLFGILSPALLLPFPHWKLGVGIT